MARTPLLLAFGEHPIQMNGMNVAADARFFKGVVVPFLEDISRKGQKAVIIREYAVGLGSCGVDCTSPEGKKQLEGFLAEHGARINRLLNETINSGAGTNDELPGWFDWGFNKEVSDINRRMPGSVMNIIEPLAAETMLIPFKMRSAEPLESPDDALGMEKIGILRSIMICKDRDRRTHLLAEKLRREDPSRAIVIPRGYAHLGMESFFDPVLYEITSASHLRGVPLFSTEAIIEAFRGTLDNARLDRYAKLSLRYSDYLDAARSSVSGAVSRNNDEAIRSLEVEARTYALRMESTAA